MKITFKFFTLILLFALLPCELNAQESSLVTISGTIKDQSSSKPLPYVNVQLRQQADSALVSGTISRENGSFSLTEVQPGTYEIRISYIGYKNYHKPLYIGSNSAYVDLGIITLAEDVQQLREVEVVAEGDAVSSAMEKKTFTLEENVSQSGGSVLQSINNLPGVTTQDGEVQLRGNNQVMILIDGKQTAITGFGKQNGLDNLPASAVERIEIITNPSAKYDANGNAGIINIILKKEKQEGFNGKVGLSTGLGALWVRKDNLPDIRSQYHATPKINPSVALNYRRDKMNFFVQAENLYTQTLNKNEFTTRIYNDGTAINQQLKRNRDTNFFNSKAGIDWFLNEANSFTVSGMYSKETIKDYGDQPFFSGSTDKLLRLWQFLEDEKVTAAMATMAFQHKFEQSGHKYSIGLNYTFDREDEKYFFTNTRPSNSTDEYFALIADQKVFDATVDYTKPLPHGFLETGVKFRRRTIPTNMQFHPSATNSVLDTGADGKATYKETIPALYGNYIYEVQKLEAELGMRLEYVNLVYEVDPNHNTYQSDGYQYFQPFPSARLTYRISNNNQLSAFYNRRVDRPDEVDIRIFPKYDDAEIIKVGNPALNPQFTNSFELAFKNSWSKGYFYSAAYHRISNGTVSRIATTVDNSNLIYNVSQNIGKSFNTGLELVIDQEVNDWLNLNLNLNGYRNRIDAFTVLNKYPVENYFTAEQEQIYSGNIKLNTKLKFNPNTEAQLTTIYLAPGIIPQGQIDSRFSLDFGIKRTFNQSRGDIFLNGSDLLNTMIVRREIKGNNFTYSSTDYYETQAIRLGVNYKL